MIVPFFNLKKSSAHRAACLALYRALLSQYPRIPISEDRWRGAINPIKYLIRKRFHKNQSQQSQRLVVAALKNGYETEELFRSAGDGDAASIERVLGIIRDYQSIGDATRAINSKNPLAPPRPPKTQTRTESQNTYRKAKNLLDFRPLPTSELTGKRGIPKLRTTQGIPFLLTKKPQSPHLTRILNKKIDRLTARNEFLEDYDDFVQGARDEDSWDRELGMGDDAGGSWTLVPKAMKNEVWKEVFAEKSANAELAGRLIDIVDREKVLAEEEKVARKEKSRNLRRG